MMMRRMSLQYGNRSYKYKYAKSSFEYILIIPRIRIIVLVSLKSLFILSVAPHQEDGWCMEAIYSERWVATLIINPISSLAHTLLSHGILGKSKVLFYYAFSWPSNLNFSSETRDIRWKSSLSEWWAAERETARERHRCNLSSHTRLLRENTDCSMNFLENCNRLWMMMTRGKGRIFLTTQYSLSVLCIIIIVIIMK